MKTPSTSSADRLRDDLALAHELADAADEISMDRFLSADLAVESKADSSPVSDADTAVEQALRDVLGARRPDDAVLGEESGETGGGTAAGSSTRSTAPRTMSGGCRSGPPSSPCRRAAR